MVEIFPKPIRISPMKTYLGSSPIQLSTADAAVLIGHVLHFAVLLGGEKSDRSLKGKKMFVLRAALVLESWIGLDPLVFVCICIHMYMYALEKVGKCWGFRACPYIQAMYSGDELGN